MVEPGTDNLETQVRFLTEAPTKDMTMKMFTLILLLAFTSVHAKQAQTQLSVSCTVLPAPAKPVVTTEVVNGVTVITIKY